MFSPSSSITKAVRRSETAPAHCRFHFLLFVPYCRTWLVLGSPPVRGNIQVGRGFDAPRSVICSASPAMGRGNIPLPIRGTPVVKVSLGSFDVIVLTDCSDRSAGGLGASLCAAHHCIQTPECCYERMTAVYQGTVKGSVCPSHYIGGKSPECCHVFKKYF